MRLKSSLLFIICFFVSISSFAQDQISFTIKNAGINVEGKFLSHTVSQKFDEADLESAAFSAKIPVESISTGNKARDKHLKKAKYFDIENHPEITFSSSEVTKTESGYLMKGKLKIKDTEKQVEILFRIESREGLSFFIGELSIDRRDFGVGKSHLILGDEVKIRLEILRR